MKLLAVIGLHTNTIQTRMHIHWRPFSIEEKSTTQLFTAPLICMRRTRNTDRSGLVNDKISRFEVFSLVLMRKPLDYPRSVIYQPFLSCPVWRHERHYVHLMQTAITSRTRLCRPCRHLLFHFWKLGPRIKSISGFNLGAGLGVCSRNS